MEVLPLHTRRLQRGDDLASVLKEAGLIADGDIVVVSSKVVSITEGSAVALSSLSASTAAKELAKLSDLEPGFAELVLQETSRMNGKVVGAVPHAILTSLRPTGMNHGRILCPNAGADQSNAGADTAIPWPKDAASSAAMLSASLNVPVVISDSCCTPGRLGVTAFALAVSGFDPVRSEAGKPDLFGRSLRITHEAVGDQLATIANTVMGNSSQSIPAAIIRGHGIPVSDFSGWVDGINPEEDLFRGSL